jgi:hypothetical protein
MMRIKIATLYIHVPRAKGGVQDLATHTKWDTISFTIVLPHMHIKGVT